MDVVAANNQEASLCAARALQERGSVPGGQGDFCGWLPGACVNVRMNSMNMYDMYN